MTTIKLAVYGTLKSTHSNHSILGPEAKVLARGIRVPDISLYECGWYPGAVHDKNGNGVEVEIVEVPTSMLRIVDGYEGYNEKTPDVSLFTREVVKLENGEEVLMYFFNRNPEEIAGERYKLIPSGRWEDKE